MVVGVVTGVDVGVVVSVVVVVGVLVNVEVGVLVTVVVVVAVVVVVGVVECVLVCDVVAVVVVVGDVVGVVTSQFLKPPSACAAVIAFMVSAAAWHCASSLNLNPAPRHCTEVAVPAGPRNSVSAVDKTPAVDWHELASALPSLSTFVSTISTPSCSRQSTWFSSTPPPLLLLSGT